MMEDIFLDLQTLRKADTLLAKIWLNMLVRRFALLVFAGLVAVFGLGMTNVAGFYALQTPVGPVWAAAIIAIGDFVLAAAVVLISLSRKPGAETEAALEVRRMAIQSLQADTQDFKATIDGFRQDLRDMKQSVAEFVHDPLDVATQRLLIPAVTAILGGMFSKKDQAS
jgi:hypothetical protein